MPFLKKVLAKDILCMLGSYSSYQDSPYFDAYLPIRIKK